MGFTDPRRTRDWAQRAMNGIRSSASASLSLQIKGPLDQACGAHGCVFDTDKRSLLVKLTDDPDEAAAAYHILPLQQRGWLRDVVRIKSVHKVELDRPAWIIVRERVALSRLPAKDRSILHESTMELVRAHEARRWPLRPEAMRLWPLMMQSPSLLPLARLRIEMSQLGLVDLDLFSNNVGCRVFPMKGWPQPPSLVLLDTGGIVSDRGLPLSTATIPALRSGSANLEDEAIAEFGVTESPYGAGYILADGRFLDLSYGRGEREEDHRTVARWIDGFDSPTDAMNEWMRRTGALRFSMYGGRPGRSRGHGGEPLGFTFDAEAPVTNAQRRTIASLIRMEPEWVAVSAPGSYGQETIDFPRIWDVLSGLGVPKSGMANTASCPGQDALEREFARLLGRDESGGHCELVPDRELHKVARKHGWRTPSGIVGFHTPKDEIYVSNKNPWSVSHELAHRYGLVDDHMARWLCEALTEFVAEEASRNTGEPHQATYGYERSIVLQHVAPATGKTPVELARVAALAERPDRAIASLMREDPRWSSISERDLCRALGAGQDEPHLLLNLTRRMAA